MRLTIGIDVGSVSTKLVAVDPDGAVQAWRYWRTQGRPIQALTRGLAWLGEQLPAGTEVVAVGTTGSARHLAGAIAGADVVKNEITAHARGALQFAPEAQTVIEIGGQDSKIILLRSGTVVDFAMNTVCAAGTGSFLDQTAHRLGMPVEEFGRLALASRRPASIAGRCTVFAESDMVHRQQLGTPVEDIVAGLCQALVRNYLTNVARGKEILPQVVFQGGVAANAGIHRALEESLGVPVVVPEHHAVMGALGAALLARDAAARTGAASRFRGFDAAGADYSSSSWNCELCANCCEIVEVCAAGRRLACWGDRCGRHSSAEVTACSEA